MMDDLDVSIHGNDRIDLIERVVHACRYTPGLIVIEEDFGRSPKVFLRHMAELLRDELDLALIDSGKITTENLLGELLQQWFVYKPLDSAESDLQLIHHYLDVSRQGGQLALIAVQQARDIDDNCLELLFRLISRHGNLSLLLCGVADATQYAVRAHSRELTLSLINLADVKNISSRQLSQSGVFPASDSSLVNHDALPRHHVSSSFGDDADAEAPLFADKDSFYKPMSGRIRADGIGRGLGDTQLGISRRLSAVSDWAGDTCSRIVKIASPDLGRVYVAIIALFVLSGMIWGVSLFTLENEGEIKASVQGVQPEVQKLPPAEPDTPPVIGAVSPGEVQQRAEEHAITRDERTNKEQEVDVPAPAPAPDNRDNESVARQLDVTEESSQEQALPDAALPDKRSPNVSKPESRPKPLPHSLAWWKAKPGNYTIQIASAHNENNIKELARRLPQSHPFLIYPGRRDGKPWFVLLYGSFTSRDQAAVELSGLAPAIRSAGPAWIRKQGDILNK